MPSFQEIEEAHNRIKQFINQTPIMTSRTLNKRTKGSIYLKCENFQRVGAFKFRGAVNTLLQLSPYEKEKGIIAHSSGNHAQAVSLAASLLNIKAVIVMPSNSPEVKVRATKEYGAEVVFCGNKPEDRAEATRKLINEFDYTLIHPYDNDNIINGAGTAALELFNEVNKLDYVFCPVGGGGLVSGTALATKGISPGTKIIAVEPSNADDAYRSFRDGKIYPSINPNTIADGLRTALSERTYSIIKEKVDEIITVTEEEILEAMKFLWERMKLVIEPSGAVSVAGILSGKIDLTNKKIGVIISGGNIDISSFFNDLSSKLAK
ncbi:MAG: threonine/serine dehydratase [Candidatus Heimdallarchaeota archaeon]|nr:threonine/serine dehydratase [Candidatus Heimdallarchaeota archaeon]MCK5047797.1 threonine/serine dehydratase [Candidatus Heimdallarchaeota archaeon]